MTFSEYVDRCLTIPYERGAHIGEFGDPMNCYTFIYWAYKLCFGIELESGDVTSFDSIKSVTYNEVKIPQDGDVVNLRTPSGHDRYHVGIVMHDVVYHFTADGLRSKNRFRMLNWIKGYYHVAAKNT